MHIKDESGFTAIDIAISVIIVTIFISLIAILKALKEKQWQLRMLYKK